MSDKTLLGIYKDILATAWMSGDDKDEIVQLVTPDGEEVKKVIIEDKVLALPTRDNLSRSGRDNLMIFHPLAEGLMGGASPVLNKLKRIMTIRASLIGPAVFESLLTGATNSAEFTKFSPDQTELLKCIKDIDETTLKSWKKLVDLSENNSVLNSFVDIHMKQNAAIDGTTFSRVTFVRFPIYEELKKNEAKLFGSSYSFRKNDRATFIRMFEFMYPGIEHNNAYSVGSNKRIAPYLDSLYGAFGKLFKITNNLYDKFSDVVPMESFVKVELDWLDDFKDIETLSTLARSVPQQYGNFAVKVEDKVRSESGSTQASMNNSAADVAPRQVSMSDIRSVNTKPAEEHKSSGERIVKIGHVTGIGRPIEQANGVVRRPEVDMRANIITNSQQQQAFQQSLDPVQAMQREIREIRAAGGVGVIGIGSANSNNLINNNNNQFNSGLQTNQNGWRTSSSNQFNQQQISSPMLNRQIAMQQMVNGNGGGFGGGFNTGSAI